jgi:hypothetical protein
MVGGFPPPHRGSFNAGTMDYHRTPRDVPIRLFWPSASLFGPLVEQHATASPDVQDILQRTTTNNYVLVQAKEQFLSAAQLGPILDQVSALFHDATIVFIRAGSVPGHDSLDFYHHVTQHRQSPTMVSPSQHLWSSVALVSSHARAVIGTSLHVQIMSFDFYKPVSPLC